jgi:hypothetical protein
MRTATATLLLLALLLGSLTGCSRQQKGEQSETPEEELLQTEGSYYPLDEGRSWTYHRISPERSEPLEQIIRIVRSEEVVGVHGAIRVMEVPSMERMKPQYDWKGVRGDTIYAGAVRENPETGELRVVPRIAPTVVLDRSRVGEQVLSRDDIAMRGSMTQTLVDTAAKVQTPLGTFSNCIKLHQQAHEERATKELSLSSNAWYAPGVGFVKDVTTDGEKSFTMVLVEYTLPEGTTHSAPGTGE